MTETLHYNYPPMEAQTVARLPVDTNWQYEPKWDGFRCLAFKDGSKIDLRSKTGRPLTRYFPEVGEKNIVLSPATTDLSVARNWLETGAPRLDGVIAKRLDLPYQSGSRNGMVKVKHLRTADCVIGGFRYGAGAQEAGSLLLGLYDNKGLLYHVGFTSGFSGIDKKSLTKVLEELATSSSFAVNIPGAPSRWNSKKSTQWIPVQPQLVVEVQYDHVTADRFRHGTRFLRWRPDKLPRHCLLSQLQSP